MSLDPRLDTLRQALADLAVVSEEDYPALRTAILDAGGPGFREGVRLAVPPLYVNNGDDTYTILPPDENRAEIACLVACLMSCLQIILLLQWAL